MPHLLILIISLLSRIPASLCRITIAEELAVLEGESIIVPCHYDPQYAGYVKYWCQGRHREFCTSLARTDQPPSANSAGEKVQIFDDPVQQVFTVTMTNLKEGDSGWYLCGVEIGNLWSADVSAFTYLKVIHGMSVVNSRMIAGEGSSITVTCLYSERYRESEKKWCRSGDWSSCFSTNSDGSDRVAISDDRTRSFTVTLKKVQLRDTGWYWCAAGQQQVAVHVQVTLQPSTTVTVSSPPTLRPSVTHPFPHEHIAKDSSGGNRHILEFVLVCISLMLLVGMTVMARKIWKQHKKEQRLRQTEELKARLSDYPGDGAVVFLNRDSL
ncbi:polymeric immunoglobulin receptor isoform X2 [Genypterus blacodes]|uniref:polymeric immunoglobulin receptor isoform X2 n=1 Tax=Genypterus blacodes TaxID=154954 RepID=UPI003F768B54